VNTHGVVFDIKSRQILIGREEVEGQVPQLTWCFPGGRSENGKDLEKTLEKTIKKHTGLKVKSLGAIFAKTPVDNERILYIYYLCEVIRGKPKASGNLVDLHWVSPEELEDYFTTSLDPRLKEHIMHLK
jgi:ADP-ribose pyrophosphatase YjhB (NUDIX family)